MNNERHSHLSHLSGNSKDFKRSVPGTEEKEQIYIFIVCQSNTINFSYKARKLDNETNFPKPKALPPNIPQSYLPEKLSQHLL